MCIMNTQQTCLRGGENATIDRFSEFENSFTAGLTLGENCLIDIMNDPCQTEETLLNGIQDLTSLKHHDHVLAGFCAALTAGILGYQK